MGSFPHSMKVWTQIQTHSEEDMFRPYASEITAPVSNS